MRENIYVNKYNGTIQEFPEPSDLHNWHVLPWQPLHELRGKKYVDGSWVTDPAYTDLLVDADRRAAYGSIAEQLDEIYHNGIDAWKARIASVKAAHPKSNGGG